jgi:hypothetical protein
VKSRNNDASRDITEQALEGDIRCALGSRRRLRAPGARRSRSCATDPDREHQASLTGQRSNAIVLDYIAAVTLDDEPPLLEIVSS